MVDDIDKLAVGAIEDRLRGLLPDASSGLHLTFGSAASFEEFGDAKAQGWVSESERDKALGLDGVWTLALFADGSDHIVRRASSLDALLASCAEPGVG